MSTIALDIPLFRSRFAAFAGDPPSDATIDVYWIMATSYISADTYGCMSAEARELALQLMTAHLLYLQGLISNGGTNTGTPGIVTASKVGDVQVSLAQPPYGTSPWRYWMNLSPYGSQLLALLDAQAVGGFYVGGLPERSAFRKVGGIF